MKPVSSYKLFTDTTFILRFIISVNVLYFLASLLFSGKGTNFSLDPLNTLSPSSQSLIFLGASGTLPVGHFQQWWSVITANWLHGSLLHILFNMLAFSQIAPFVAKVYGIHKMFIIYSITGIAGFVISCLAGVQLTIGASGAICGLIGATLYFGKSRGGVLGDAVYRQTMGWVIGIGILGLLVPNINNWGHGGGLVFGIGAGMLLGYNDQARENILHVAAGTLLALITMGLLLWRLLAGISTIF
ncbi:MAG: rhomboid family intramembrane serine protease [Desulfobacteraceae bacterium]